jgi:hypothetical protein
VDTTVLTMDAVLFRVNITGELQRVTKFMWKVELPMI